MLNDICGSKSILRCIAAIYQITIYIVNRYITALLDWIILASMKPSLSKNRIITLGIVLAVAGLLLVAYLARGFIRESVVPAYARLFYTRSVNAEYNKGLDEVRRVAPFNQIKVADAAPLKCQRYYAKTFHVTVGCVKLADQQIPFNFTDENDFNKKTHAMQKALADVGWHSSVGFQSTFRTPLGGDRWGYNITYNNKSEAESCFLHVQATQDSQSLTVSYSCVRHVGFLGKANSYY